MKTKIMMTMLVLGLLAMPHAAANTDAMPRSVSTEGPTGAQDTESCGGMAPFTDQCEIGPVEMGTLILWMDVGVVFTGTVTIRVETSTGWAEHRCDFIGGEPGGCALSWSGTFEPGQWADVSGRALGLGEWEVGITT